MAQFIDGDGAMFDQLLYGNAPAASQEFLDQERSKFQQYSSPMAVQFFQSAFELEAAMRDNRAIQMAKAASRKVMSLWQSDEIRTLATIGEFQHAPQKMRRFIMAEPETRSLWKKQLLSGYDDLFEDFKDEVGEEVLEFRQVMDGVIVDGDGSEDSYEWECAIYDDYSDEPISPDLEITVDAQFDILESWDKLRTILADGKEDPTSEINASLL